MDIEAAAKKLHDRMKLILKPNEWTVYKGLFIDNKEEEEVADLLGFKSNETNRKPGYKQIKNIRKKILEKVKRVLLKGEIDIL